MITSYKKINNFITTSIPKVNKNDFLSEVEHFLSLNKFDTIDYIYVINEKDELIGVFSIKELFLNSKDKKVEDVMKTKIVKAELSSTPEQVAILALKNNLKAIPIVNENNKLLGIIPSDSILEILHLENVEDFLRSVGIHSPVRETLEGNSLFLAKARLPWLIFGLIGGTIAALIVEYFEFSLKKHFILAAFIPLMVYIADAVGTQTETIFIRNLIFKEKINILSYFIKEFTTGILISTILALILFITAKLVFNADFLISLILMVSLILTIMIAMGVGIIVPWFLNKVKKDPAIGSGPFGTIIRDILTLTVYLLISFLIF